MNATSKPVPPGTPPPSPPPGGPSGPTPTGPPPGRLAEAYDTADLALRAVSLLAARELFAFEPASFTDAARLAASRARFAYGMRAVRDELREAAGVAGIDLPARPGRVAHSGPTPSRGAVSAGLGSIHPLATGEGPVPGSAAADSVALAAGESGGTRVRPDAGTGAGGAPVAPPAPTTFSLPRRREFQIGVGPLYDALPTHDGCAVGAVADLP